MTKLEDLPVTKLRDPSDETGQCRICRCTYAQPCTIRRPDGRDRTCYWVTQEHDVCSTCLPEAIAIDYAQQLGAAIAAGRLKDDGT